MKRLLLLILLCLTGCLTATEREHQLFNEEQRWFVEEHNPTRAVIDTILTVRIRAYGSNAKKQADWDKDWRSKYPNWQPVQNVTVSSNPIEIWVDLEKDDEGALVFNPMLLGHEMIHAVGLQNKKFLNPDKY